MPEDRLSAASQAADWLEAAAPRRRPLAFVRRWVSRVFLGRVALAAVVVAVAAGWLGGSYHGPQPLRGALHDVMVAALVYLLAWLLLRFARALPEMLGEIAGEAVAYLAVGLLVITLPLLLIPAYRRWLIRQFRDSEGRGLR